MWQLQTLALSQSSVIPSFGSDDALQTFSCCQSCCGNIYPAVKRDFNLLVPLRTFLKNQAVQIKGNTVTGTGEECVHSNKQWKVLSPFSLFGKVTDIKLFLKCVFQRKGTWKGNTSVTYRENVNLQTKETKMSVLKIIAALHCSLYSIVL